MCDEWYDPHGDRAPIHEHPEPQSGIYRDIWIATGLDYNDWLLTPAGKKWEKIRNER